MKNVLYTILIFLLFVTTVSAQTHNVTRGSKPSTPKPNPSTTTTAKKTGISTKKTGSSSTTPRKDSRGTPQLKQQPAASSSTHSKQSIIQNLIDNMVIVKGGEFTMGGTAEQGPKVDDDEKPVHRVRLSSFYMGRFEVTQEEWEAVMGNNPSVYKGAKRPVENVSWDDCQDFIRKLNEMTGNNFRLPTEAEWEYAARGGNKSKNCKYSGSNNIGDVAWYAVNINDNTHSVGQKSPNELGLYDMSGNVWEWCYDWYGDYNSSTQNNPKGSSNGSGRVRRGGGWGNDSGDCRVSYRSYYTPINGSNIIGLRLAL